jgi:predicted RND superfamily exporter protein
MRDALKKVFGFVIEHNLLVLVLMLLVTAGIAAGVGQLQTQSQTDASNTAADTEVAQKLEYIQSSYDANESNGSTGPVPTSVYVRDQDGNVLSKASLVDTLEYQRTATENASVATGLGDRQPLSVANLVATRAAGSQDATLPEQITALEAASESEVEHLVKTTLSEDSSALSLVPTSYEPGTASAESTRVVFQFAAEDSGPRGPSADSAATAALYETAQDTGSPEFFTVGERARGTANAQYQQNMIQLIVPAALLMILLVLGFAYRDLVDVVVGFGGVVLSVVWMFGILGWMQIPAGMTMIVGPVLVVGLSVDYGLHVFMRYREERGEKEHIREPMIRSLSSITVALGLVTMTAMVGFMANALNELAAIRQLAYGISLGVLSTFVVSVTLVPAMKVTVDSLLGRVGLERRKQPLGKTRLLEPVLSSGVTLARKAAPAVIVLALLAGSAGAVAWTDLDRQSFQQDTDGVAEWKQNLPGPLAWDVSEESRNFDYVNQQYRAATEDDRRRSNVLIEGSVTDPAALSSVQAAHDRAGETDAVYSQGNAVPLRSPLTVMERVAARNDEFAATFADADTDGDGVPDRNIDRVYDALFAAAPDAASQVVDRDSGEYRSLRVVVPIEPGATTPQQTDAMRDVASAAEGDAVSAIAVGSGTLTAAELSQVSAGILRTLLLALGAVGVLLTLVYRFMTGSATLGAVTAVPIVAVTALVVGGMWLFGVPLTLLTALLLSLVIGLGIDYNIHISDRFAQELERGRTVSDALHEATTGTGGALLGSTLTSVGAFSALLLHPHPQLQSFGMLVVLAMVTSFVVAVFVLPSLITVWARYLHTAPTVDEPTVPTLTAQDD